MRAKVFTPQVPGWAIWLAGLCWLSLTAVTVMLSHQDGFLSEMAAALASTAAGVALGITGVGAIIQRWQKWRMRQRTGPYIVKALEASLAAYGELVYCYTSSGSSGLPAAKALTASNAATLLAPPLLPERDDLTPIYDWTRSARIAYLRLRGRHLGLLEDEHIDEAEIVKDEGLGEAARPSPAALTNSDTELVIGLRNVTPQLVHSARNLSEAVSTLIEFDAPHADKALDVTLTVRTAVERQMSALQEADDDLLGACANSWYSCSEVLSGATSIALWADNCLAAVQRVAGKRVSPLQRSAAEFGHIMQTSTKIVILKTLRVRLMNEQHTAAISALDAK
jgi:hypothetical protein